MTGGIPGALSNEPPGPSQAPERTPTQGNVGSTSTTTTPSKSTVRYTVNNELDRSIVHKRQSPGNLRKLSVAVVVDNKQMRNEKGEAIQTPYTQEELDRFTVLVKEAVGFSALRGDSVNVINAAFTPPPELEPVPEPSIMDQPWVWDLGKQILGGILAALVLFGVLRPVMRNLSSMPHPALARAGGGDMGDGLADDQVTLSGSGEARLPKPNEYESDLEMAKAMVVQEPKRVAQVVKQWVNE
jgi:flagellar M-ring protein FliF